MEKTIVKVDSQIINSMNLCAERYRLEFVDNWRPANKPMALERGSIMHHMVAYYYAQKQKGRTDPDHHNEVVQECIKLARMGAAESYHITPEELENDIRVFQEYVLHWQYDGWEILDIEQPFTKLLFDSDELQILYEGIIDLRIRDPKIGQCIVDNKTESRKSNPFILSNQFQGYEWAFNCPVIINKIGYQTSLEPHEKFRRILHDTGKPAIDEWVKDTVDQVREAIRWHSTGTFRKNRTSCDKYSGCIFQKVCKVPEEVRDFKLQAYFYRDKPWDVYSRDLVGDEAALEEAS